MRLGEFDYELPPERIAQQPPAERDAARMLVLHRGDGRLEDRRFRELPELLAPGDLLVANESRVFPARLLGQRASGGKVHVLLLTPVAPDEWTALVHPGARIDVGARLFFEADLSAEVLARGSRGERRLRFSGVGSLSAWLEAHGHVPLPPYIRRPDEATDRERYQTIYAQQPGSAAAPTAGLHFTARVQAAATARGIDWTAISLHVGLGTFRPVATDEIEQHPMHLERFSVSETAATALNRARMRGKRIVAIGTTAARVLETIAPAPGQPFRTQAGETGIFLYPGGRPFRAIDALLTNFHAPKTTLLMMIAAFAGLEPARHAYQHALAHEYRFLSYGDCMLIV
ncbi:MAG: tRNA preQ1(34) S-adenosylmethionine ribosyltransferase-isomerase QueA [Terriglobales bacterium]